MGKNKQNLIPKGSDKKDKSSVQQDDREVLIRRVKKVNQIVKELEKSQIVTQDLLSMEFRI
jgi:hypothetical protein